MDGALRVGRERIIKALRRTSNYFGSRENRYMSNMRNSFYEAQPHYFQKLRCLSNK